MIYKASKSEWTESGRPSSSSLQLLRNRMTFNNGDTFGDTIGHDTHTYSAEAEFPLVLCGRSRRWAKCAFWVTFHAETEAELRCVSSCMAQLRWLSCLRYRVTSQSRSIHLTGGSVTCRSVSSISVVYFVILPLAGSASCLSVCLSSVCC